MNTMIAITTKIRSDNNTCNVIGGSIHSDYNVHKDENYDDDDDDGGGGGGGGGDDDDDEDHDHDHDHNNKL